MADYTGKPANAKSLCEDDMAVHAAVVLRAVQRKQQSPLDEAGSEKQRRCVALWASSAAVFTSTSFAEVLLGGEAWYLPW